MPLILPSNSISAGGYEVDNSLRFDDGSSDRLNYSVSSTTNTYTWTFSTWIKRANLGISDGLLIGQEIDGSNFDFIRFNSSDRLFYLGRYSGVDYRKETNRVFRDPSAWYHIVVARNGSSVNIYVNGVQETSFLTDNTFPSSTGKFNTSGSDIAIGGRTANVNYLPAYFSETVWIDGSQLDPTSFGEFDEDTGIWKPIDVSGLTFGTNGFYLDFENSGSLGADVSGNGNNFTVNNLTSIDQTTDTPTNNFATLNPLDPSPNAITFSEGNLKATGTSGDSGRSTFGTFALSQGKWWCEIKVTVGTTYPLIGIIDSSSSRKRATYFADSDSGTNQSGFGVLANDDIYHNGSIVDTWVTFSTGDIIGLGLDMDASPPTLTFKKNNGDEKTINTEVPNSGFYNFPAIGLYYSSAVVEVNFGNPSYSISSGNADANGYGNFEHAPKSGYYSCCSKNLAEFG